MSLFALALLAQAAVAPPPPPPAPPPPRPPKITPIPSPDRPLGPDVGVGTDEVGEEIELLVEQKFVIVEFIAEEGEAFGEGAAPEDHLGPAVREGVEGGQPLENADRIIGGKHGDGRAEADAAGARGDGGKHDLGGGNGEIGAVMFAHAKEMHADLIGQNALFDDIAQHGIMGFELAVGTERGVAEGI